MSTTINQIPESFKDFEKKVYREVCQLACDLTKDYFKILDELYHEQRDKEKYRDKGKRPTTVKTVYGYVEYERYVYETVEADGSKKYVYLLDEKLQIKDVGQYSGNMVERILKEVTTKSYAASAEALREEGVLDISPMGVWGIVQKIGERIIQEEDKLIAQHKNNQLNGETVAPVLFEETDGIHIKTQREAKKSAEIKMYIAHDGWKQTDKDRYNLDNKIVLAGVMDSHKLRQYKEAAVAAKYNTDEIQVRILNADGAGWTKGMMEPDTIFQLDPFHRNKMVRENISDKYARKKIFGYLEENNIPKLLKYIEVYRDSVEDTEETEKADAVLKYFSNNAEGLIPYEKRTELPKSPEGIVYRHGGVMEGNNWTIIAHRMKHNHTCWSTKGGNNMAKLLAWKFTKGLEDITEILKEDDLLDIPVANDSEVMSAAQVPKKIGHRYEPASNGHLVPLDMPSVNKNVWLDLAGC